MLYVVVDQVTKKLRHYTPNDMGYLVTHSDIRSVGATRRRRKPSEHNIHEGHALIQAT